LELSLPCTEADLPHYERALERVGALAVTLVDAHADAADEQAIFEPGVGQTPLWGEMVLTALFAGGTSAELLQRRLAAADDRLGWSGIAFRDVADQDWERAWMDQYEPLQFGARTWIVPWNHELPDGADAQDAAVVRLDPGLAFGSGTHPTTALCLQWLDVIAAGGELRDATVLDFGCGSGILALAALKLGAARAVGVDNDPQALLATADNAQRNEVGDRLAVYLPDDELVQAYPVVVANILASALIALADTLAARVAPGGRIALSGILAGQEDEVLASFAGSFADLHVARLEDWIRISGVRRR
ncbi:MAG: 50S ribosomal protein L11 methyltransferase, partial [Pseudomonadota bacterium]|nr:50S ribosomal protein L11 methyltransferase [Pseudomonadota bacterium]